MENNFIEIDSKSIKAPEGVAILMENLWLRHKACMNQRANNVYMIELPPPTKEELRKCQKSDKSEYDQEELFGAFI